mgnify:CR=1 FL=1
MLTLLRFSFCLLLVPSFQDADSKRVEKYEKDSSVAFDYLMNQNLINLFFSSRQQMAFMHQGIIHFLNRLMAKKIGSYITPMINRARAAEVSARPGPKNFPGTAMEHQILVRR